MINSVRYKVIMAWPKVASISLNAFLVLFQSVVVVGILMSLNSKIFQQIDQYPIKSKPRTTIDLEMKSSMKFGGILELKDVNQVTKLDGYLNESNSKKGSMNDERVSQLLNENVGRILNSENGKLSEEINKKRIGFNLDIGSHQRETATAQEDAVKRVTFGSISKIPSHQRFYLIDSNRLMYDGSMKWKSIDLRPQVRLKPEQESSSSSENRESRKSEKNLHGPLEDIDTQLIDSIGTTLTTLTTTTTTTATTADTERIATLPLRDIRLKEKEEEDKCGGCVLRNKVSPGEVVYELATKKTNEVEYGVSIDIGFGIDIDIVDIEKISGKTSYIHDLGLIHVKKLREKEVSPFRYMKKKSKLESIDKLSSNSARDFILDVDEKRKSLFYERKKEANKEEGAKIASDKFVHDLDDDGDRKSDIVTRAIKRVRRDVGSLRLIREEKKKKNNLNEENNLRGVYRERITKDVSLFGGSRIRNEKKKLNEGYDDIDTGKQFTIEHKHRRRRRRTKREQLNGGSSNQIISQDELIELLAEFYAHSRETQDKVDQLLKKISLINQTSTEAPTTTLTTTTDTIKLVNHHSVLSHHPSIKKSTNNSSLVSQIGKSSNKVKDSQQRSLVPIITDNLSNNNNNNNNFKIPNLNFLIETIKMKYGADDASLHRWLQYQRLKFKSLANATFHFVNENPNRTINICPDGPKVIIVKNQDNIGFSRFYHCLTHDQWIQRLYDDVKLAPVHYPIILLNILIFLFGTLGNIFVCLSVYRNHQLRNVTNYYIVNLAFADLLVIIICLPPTFIWDLSLTWFFGDIACKLIMYLQDVSISVSVLTLTAISIDRYYAICYPLKFKSSLNQAKRVIVMIWLTSLIIMAPDLVYLAIKPSAELKESGLDTVLYTDCHYTWSRDATSLFQFVKTILLYLLPFVFMFCAHYYIMRTLRKASNMQPNDARLMTTTSQFISDPESQSIGEPDLRKLTSHSKSNPQNMSPRSIATDSVIATAKTVDSIHPEGTNTSLMIPSPVSTNENENNKDKNDNDRISSAPSLSENSRLTMSTIPNGVRDHSMKFNFEPNGGSKQRQNQIQNHNNNNNQNQNEMHVLMHNKTQLESRRKAAKMLMLIVFMFGICYLPVHLINFLRNSIENIPQNDVTMTFAMLAHSLCYLNSAINPIIYNHMNSVFRAEFRKSLSCLLLRRNKDKINRMDSKMSNNTITNNNNNNNNKNNVHERPIGMKKGRHITAISSEITNLDVVVDPEFEIHTINGSTTTTKVIAMNDKLDNETKPIEGEKGEEKEIVDDSELNQNRMDKNQVVFMTV